MTGDQAGTEEVVQEVFLACGGSPERFQPGHGGLAGCCWRASRPSVDAVRRQEAVPRRAAALRAVAAVEAADPPNNRTEDVVEERMRSERVRWALAEPPQGHLEALALAYDGGYTQCETAPTGTRRGTMKTRIHRAMRQLHTALDDPADPADLERLAVADPPGGKTR